MAGKKVVVVADINGTLCSWNNGYFSSPDRKLLNEVKLNARLGEKSKEITELTGHTVISPISLTMYGEEIMPGNNNVLSAAAAMKTVNPGRTIFPHYESEALDEYFENAYLQESESSYVLLNGHTDDYEENEDEQETSVLVEEKN